MDDFAARLQTEGDVFGEQLAAINVQTLPTQQRATHRHPELVEGPPSSSRPNGHGAIIAAAVEILSDGKTHSAEEIWRIAHERGLLKGKGAIQSFYGALEAYIERRQIAGRRPIFIKTIDHKFRINEPADLWPDSVTPASGTSSPDVEAIITRLHATASTKAATEFEVATCDAFSALGFLATHVGGKAAPDGYADAPLGSEGYRVMIECKSGASEGASDVYEAAKFKDAYRGQYCFLLNAEPVSNQSATFAESKNHGVSLWTIDDLALALRENLSPEEVKPAFAPGIIAGDVLPDILWIRDHGEAKRVRIVANIIRRVGWITQCAAAQAGPPSDAPILTEDAAMLVVDQKLAARGCHVNCTREEVRLAFAWLTDPTVGIAMWTADKTGIVICRRDIKEQNR